MRDTYLLQVSISPRIKFEKKTYFSMESKSNPNRLDRSNVASNIRLKILVRQCTEKEG